MGTLVRVRKAWLEGLEARRDTLAADNERLREAPEAGAPAGADAAGGGIFHRLKEFFS